MPDPDVWHGLAQDLLECACAALETTERGCPTRACVVPGGQVLEDNCCDGQLQVLIERIFRTVDFPNQSADVLSCGAGFTAMDVLVALRRCAPGPSCEQADLNASLLYAEGSAMFAAVVCCLEAGSDVVVSTVRDMRPSPGSPNGGCTGWDLRVTLALNESCGGCADGVVGSRLLPGGGIIDG